ncbi:hypothetical protein IG631_18591 [Alternaria alternata]|nr:hypothetical protein IG631_18591 [Alternaria alternata]
MVPRILALGFLRRAAQPQQTALGSVTKIADLTTNYVSSARAVRSMSRKPKTVGYLWRSVDCWWKHSSTIAPSKIGKA